MSMTQLLFKKMDLTLCLNGAIGGLVAITAGPDLQQHAHTILIGGIGGALVVIAVPLIDKLRVDDVVGALSAVSGARSQSAFSDPVQSLPSSSGSLRLVPSCSPPA